MKGTHLLHTDEPGRILSTSHVEHAIDDVVKCDGRLLVLSLYKGRRYDKLIDETFKRFHFGFIKLFLLIPPINLVTLKWFYAV